MRRYPFPTARLTARNSGSRFDKSFDFNADQRYSGGFSSGAYAGKRTTLIRALCVSRNICTVLALCAGSPSQKSKSFLPRKCRRSSFKYTRTTSAFTAPGRLFKNNFGFLPPAVQTSVPIRLKFFHDPLDFTTGVRPFIAHVLRTVGLSDTPDSS